MTDRKHNTRLPSHGAMLRDLKQSISRSHTTAYTPALSQAFQHAAALLGYESRIISEASFQASAPPELQQAYGILKHGILAISGSEISGQTLDGLSAAAIAEVNKTYASIDVRAALSFRQDVQAMWKLATKKTGLGTVREPATAAASGLSM